MVASPSALSLTFGKAWLPSIKRFRYYGTETKYLLDLTLVVSDDHHQYPALLEDLSCWRLVPTLGYLYMSAPPSDGECVMTLQGIALATVELLGCFAIDVNLDLPRLIPCF